MDSSVCYFRRELSKASRFVEEDKKFIFRLIEYEVVVGRLSGGVRFKIF